jgi:superfamily II DNA or RNA helicase
MAVAQCRVCALCGEDMVGPIEADHIIPFSRGGPTTMSNGQATCASCNRKKGNLMQDIYTPKSFKLRAWQHDCLFKLSRAIAQQKQSFSLQAWPGAGKTKLAVCAFKTAEQMGAVDKLLWVVPSSNLKKDIGDHERSKDLPAEGIGAVHDIANALVEESASAGRVVWPQEQQAWLVTYSQVANNPALFAALCNNFRVMVVLDEVHHVRDSASWGEKIRIATERAKFVLPMSGTLFTTDGDSIPFVNFVDRVSDDGKTLRTYSADYTFGMSDAIKPQPGEKSPSVRPLTYIKVNASGEFTYRNLETDNTFTRIADLKAEGEKAKLTPLLSVRSQMVHQMLKAGIDALDEYRDIEGDATAGGLIVCMDGNHARAVADFMRDTFQEDVTVVLHDTAGASAAIDNFRKTDKRWLITVRMVSEGVDIRRLRVGVYLTNYLTYLFLIQWLGRMWRWNPTLENESEQQGTVVIPAHDTLASWVSELENITYEAALKNGDSSQPEESGDSKTTKNVLENANTKAEIEGGVVRSFLFGSCALDKAKELHRKLNGITSVGTLAAVLETMAEEEQSESAPVMLAHKERSEVINRLGTLRAAIKREMLNNPPDDWDGENPWQFINGRLNRATGVERFVEKMASLEDIIVRKEAAKKMLHVIRGL